MAHLKEQNEVRETIPEEFRNTGLNSHGLLNKHLSPAVFSTAIFPPSLVNKRMPLAIQLNKGSVTSHHNH